MKRLLTLLGALSVLLAAAGPAGADLMLEDGTVTADTYYAGSGLNAYWAESVTAGTIDAVNLGAGQYVQVSGRITDISNPSSSWAEVGLIPKDRYDHWQTAYGGGWRPAVFDKGLYVVHWQSGSDLGLALKEGWDDWTSTTYLNSGGPYGWELPTPSTSPWEFSFTMVPNPGDPSANESELTITGQTVYGTSPFLYGGDAGNPVANDNDYTACYLIAQIWSTTANASFSFEDVQATVVPLPGAVLLGMLGLSAAGLKLRKYV